VAGELHARLCRLHGGRALRVVWRRSRAALHARLRAITDEFRTVLPGIDTRATIPFNRKAEWGEDGRIVPGAPVYSPFIRRKQHLDLE